MGVVLLVDADRRVGNPLAGANRRLRTPEIKQRKRAELRLQVVSQRCDRAAHLADRYRVWAVVLCRPIPVLAEATVVFAGLVRAPLWRFVWLTALSNLGIAAGYAAIGAFSMRLDSFLLAFIGAVAVPGIAFLIAKGVGSRDPSLSRVEVPDQQQAVDRSLVRPWTRAAGQDRKPLRGEA